MIYYITSDDSTTTYTTTASDYYNYSNWRNFSTTTGTASIAITPWQTYTSPYTDYLGQHSGTYPSSYTNNEQQNQQRQQINQKSPEQLRQEAEAVERAKREEAEATERAKNLLLEHLDEENKQRYLENKPLEIISKLFGNMKYHVPISKLGRIKALKESNVITELCISVREGSHLPVEDVILTKLLYILHDERNMLKTANHSNVQENLLLGLN